MKHQDLIKVSPEKRKEMIQAIQSYYLKEKEEMIGDLAAGILLDFFIEKIAPDFYNQGVYDSYVYMEKSIDDLLAIQKQPR